MLITLWGTRGSLACSGPDFEKYGGNTSCVEVRGTDNSLLILDAGTGICRLGTTIPKNIKKIHILLTHLHLDHIQGLSFFAPLYDPEREIHIYGPGSTKGFLHNMLTKYLSPPLFPVFLRDLPCQLYLHEVSSSEFDIDHFHVQTGLVCHPGFTLGYRISCGNKSMAYLPDHEPALGALKFPAEPDWTSGYNLIKNVDLLLHDSQYSMEEYPTHVGWGHSAISDALKLATLAKVKTFVTFHHDPFHNDQELDNILAKAVAAVRPNFEIQPGREGKRFELL